MLGYKNQQSNKLITDATLSASYGATSCTRVIPVAGFVQGVFDIKYTRGAGEASSKLELRIRVSSNGTDWYQLVNESVAGGVSGLTPRVFEVIGGASAVNVSLPIDLMYKYLEVSIRETSVTTNFGKVSLDTTLSGI